MAIRDPLVLKNFDGWATPVGCAAARLLATLTSGRKIDHRPLIVRPGGMGDLILLCIACENLGIDLKHPLWLIERRSRVWADHAGLHYWCYDEDLTRTHRRLAGRFQTVINTEQLFGLAQATALLARARGGKLISFSTNQGANWADEVAEYDPEGAHEAGEFGKLLALALGARLAAMFGGSREPMPRERKQPASGTRVVGISGLQSPQRAFSVDEWARFVRDWAKGAPFQIGCAPGDLEFGERLAERFPKQARVFRGSFGELCSLIAASPEVFTVDGGLLHVASYYGVPATAVFTSGRDTKWAPMVPGSRVIRRRDLDCQPCTWFGQVPACRRQFACKSIDLPGKEVAIELRT